MGSGKHGSMRPLDVVDSPPAVVWTFCYEKGMSKSKSEVILNCLATVCRVRSKDQQRSVENVSASDAALSLDRTTR